LLFFFCLLFACTHTSGHSTNRQRRSMRSVYETLGVLPYLHELSCGSVFD
jgi:hypothetical protein